MGFSKLSSSLLFPCALPASSRPHRGGVAAAQGPPTSTGRPRSSEASPFGEGLGGANIGLLSTPDEPMPGSNVRFRITNIPNGTSGFLWLNTRQVAQVYLGGTMLTPLSGAMIRMPFKLTLGVGQVVWPVSYSLCGRTLYAQASALDATQPLGRALTNALRLDIGQ